ncbi:MAG: hypothetical protein K2J93_04150, partial [Anaeroplasmataceae bacterium]|nr:hypothetical protein [Anaeroplasmataceae bacterium]
SNQYSYQDLELKRYTFLAYERKRVAYSNKGNSFVDYIYVKEEEKPLTIVDTVRDAYQMKDFDAIRYEDIIYCYVTAHKALDASYDVIEIKANENVILSLKEYNQEISENGLAGIIVFSIGILACLGMSIYFFVLYKKDE